jgi:hypothetical protein
VNDVTACALIAFLFVSHGILHWRMRRMEGRLTVLESRGLRTLTEVRAANDKTEVVADTLTQTAGLLQAALPATPPPWHTGDPDRRTGDSHHG